MENLKEKALSYHQHPQPGKIAVVPTKPYADPADLSLAYSPGVAYPCKEIKENPAAVRHYTGRSNLVAAAGPWSPSSPMEPRYWAWAISALWR